MKRKEVEYVSNVISSFFKVFFSVDLDSVYQGNCNIPIYKLSTVDPLRRNRFILIVRLISTDVHDRDQYFTSPEFLIRSRRTPRVNNVEVKSNDGRKEP